MQVVQSINKWLSDHRVTAYMLLLLLCIAGRLTTTIYYVEDIDALRFFLSAYGYDVAALRPHFPGYPVFCFLLRMLYLLTGHIAVSFSILGGLSIFAIILSAVELCRLVLPELKRGWLPAILFFNPLLWVMSNSYMPDIMGLAILMAALYSFARTYPGSVAWVYGFHVLVGLLCGVRLSYLPFLFLPWLVIFYQCRRLWWQHIAVVTTAVLIWLVPMVIDTGLPELIGVAQRHTDGHFNEWGGSVISSQAGFGTRILRAIQSIWANGMGGWWPGRGYLYGVYSVGLIAVIAVGFQQLYHGSKTTGTPTTDLIKILLLSLGIYMVWAFLFQNIVHKPRHIMPVIPFICMALAAGYQWMAMVKWRVVIVCLVLGLNLVTTAIVVKHHTEPSAVSQLKDRMLLYNTEMAVFTGAPVMNYYLLKHGWDQGQLRKDTADVKWLKEQYAAGNAIFTLQKMDTVFQTTPVEIMQFDHDPYVSRMWSHLTLYRYQRR